MKFIYRKDTDTMRVSFREDLSGHESEKVAQVRSLVKSYGLV